MLEFVSYCLYATICISATLARSDNPQTVKPVIIDTDLYADVDDVGALAIANILHNCGLCDVRGIVMNTRSRYGALAASAINTYYGNGDIPIAALRPLTNDIFVDEWFFARSDYASKLAAHFPRTLQDAKDTETPMELYTGILESAEDSSVTIISLGFLTNLANLLESSHGLSLIKTKVHKLVVMGGTYPGPGWEFNFGQDSDATASVLKRWPDSVAVTYIGFELGINIISGSNLKRDATPDSPILAAYEWFVGRCSTTRESWDPITMLYGILGFDGFDQLGVPRPFEYGNDNGKNTIVESNGTNAWVDDKKVTNQRWLKLANGVCNVSVAEILDRFYVHDPADSTCLSMVAEAKTEL